MTEVRGPARALFAAVLLMVGGIINTIYGIAAIGNSNFFVHNTEYVFGSLKTWGWVMLIIGILEILAALSLFGGGNYGRIFAIVMGSLAAIVALLDIASYPLWSIAVFGLSLWIVYGLTAADSYEGWGEAEPGSGPTIGRGPRPPA
jgi:type IV secretory pathway TrbD component